MPSAANRRKQKGAEIHNNPFGFRAQLRKNRAKKTAPCNFFLKQALHGAFYRFSGEPELVSVFAGTAVFPSVAVIPVSALVSASSVLGITWSGMLRGWHKAFGNRKQHLA